MAGGRGGKLKDYDAVLKAIQSARPKGVSGETLARVRGIAASWVQTASSHGMPMNEVLRRLRDGAMARQVAISAVETQVAAGQGIVSEAACRAGCAFCCILNGEDGGTIGKDEAVRLFDALQPLAGEPDGRVWHPKGCPSLDPETRMCRAYEARPLICRTYMSTRVDACEDIANGTPAAGTGVLGAQLIHLALLALSRAVLTGTAMVQTYSMATVARMAVEGASRDDALAAARHGPSSLVDELARQSKAARSAT